MGRGQPTSKEVGPRNAARESLPQIFRTLTHLKHKLELVFHLGLSDMAPWPNYSGSSSFSSNGSWKTRDPHGSPWIPLRLQEPYGASQLHVAHFLALGRKNSVLASDTGTLETFTRNTPKLKLEHVGT